MKRLLSITLLLAPLFPVGDDWPHWRGPDRTGVSPEVGWTSEGAPEPLWEAEVGLGYSSPSIVGERLYTRGYYAGLDGEEGVDLTFCLDLATGSEVWVHESPAKLWDNMHEGGTLTTPVVAGDTVFVLSRLGPLFALSAKDGGVRWERRIATELEVVLGPFGFCSSPVVVGDLVFVNVGKTIALDVKTGETRWATRDYGPSYSTPTPFTWKDRNLLAVFNGAGLAVLDRASGEELAVFEWTSGYNVNSASPIVIGDEIFISTGYDEKGCALLKLTDDGLEAVWTKKSMRTKMNGCVLVDGMLYGFDASELACLDLEGNERWTERGLGKGTVIASDGRLIVLSEEGELLIAPASAEGFAPTYRKKLFEDGVCWTTPVLAGGRIFCRSNKGRLVALDHRPAAR